MGPQFWIRDLPENPPRLELEVPGDLEMNLKMIFCSGRSLMAFFICETGKSEAKTKNPGTQITSVGMLFLLVGRLGRTESDIMKAHNWDLELQSLKLITYYCSIVHSRAHCP